MKMIIEISGGCVTNIVSTQECEIYLVDHDNLTERDEGDSKAIIETREAMQPNRVTYEGDHVAIPGGSATPEFDACLDDALEPYQGEATTSAFDSFCEIPVGGCIP